MLSQSPPRRSGSFVMSCKSSEYPGLMAKRMRMERLPVLGRVPSIQTDGGCHEDLSSTTLRSSLNLPTVALSKGLSAFRREGV
jgi:hypothetical protein